MQKQEVKKSTDGSESDAVGGVLQKARALKEQKTHRKVILKFKFSCGCTGDEGTYFAIERIVDFDSPLKNGDVISEPLGSDIPLQEWDDYIGSGKAKSWS